MPTSSAMRPRGLDQAGDLGAAPERHPVGDPRGGGGVEADLGELHDDHGHREHHDAGRRRGQQRAGGDQGQAHAHGGAGALAVGGPAHGGGGQPGELARR